MAQEARFDIRKAERTGEQKIVFQKNLCNRKIIAEVDLVIDFFGADAQPVHVHDYILA